jgi:hypothetical protein
MKLEGVLIELGGEQHELKFTHKAIKLAENMLNKTLGNLIDENISTKEIEVLAFAGLMHEKNQSLTQNKVIDMIDEVPTNYITEKISEAYVLAVGGKKEIKEFYENKKEDEADQDEDEKNSNGIA